MQSKKIKQFLGPRPFPQVFYHLDITTRIFRGLFKRHPLKRENSPLSCTPFFIIGSGRSGSTLLRAILTMNPAVCIPPESYVLGRVIRGYKYFSFLPWNLLSRFVISEFESFSQFNTWEINLMDFYQIAQGLPVNDQNLAQLLDRFYLYYASEKCPGSNRWGDKTPTNTFDVHVIDQVFPGAKYIHIIRDGRDVVSSYISSGIYQSVQDAAVRWIRSIDAAQDFGKKVGESRYLELRYENLVRRPEAATRSVCSFLKMDYSPEMLETWKRFDRLGDSGLAHHANLTNPINEDSIGKWMKKLSRQDQVFVNDHLRSRLLRLGYSVN